MKYPSGEWVLTDSLIMHLHYLYVLFCNTLTTRCVSLVDYVSKHVVRLRTVSSSTISACKHIKQCYWCVPYTHQTMLLGRPIYTSNNAIGASYIHIKQCYWYVPYTHQTMLLVRPKYTSNNAIGASHIHIKPCYWYVPYTHQTMLLVRPIYTSNNAIGASHIHIKQCYWCVPCKYFSNIC